MIAQVLPYAVLLTVVVLIAAPLPATGSASARRDGLGAGALAPGSLAGSVAAGGPLPAGGHGVERRVAGYGLAVCTLVLVLFSGLRYQVGTDFGLNTRRFFVAVHYTLAEAFEISNQESAFTWLTRLTGHLGGPQTFFFLMAFATVVLTVWSLVGIGDRPAWTIFFYVTLGAYFATFNLVRQGLAIALILVAWRRLDRHRAWSVVAIVAASLFHVSAAPVALLVVLSRRMRPRRALLLASAGGSLLIWVAGTAGLLRSEWFAFMNENWARFDQLWDRAGIGSLMELLAALALLAVTLRWVQVAEGPWASRAWSMLLFAPPGLALGAVNSQAPRLALYFTVFAVPLAALWLSSRRRLAPQVVMVVVAVGYLLFMLLSGRHSLVPFQLYPLRGAIT